MYAYSTTEATACWSENTNSSVITSHKKTERRKKNKNATGVGQQQDATVRASRASVALSEARADTKTLPRIAYQYTAVVIIVLVDNVEPTVRQYLVLCFTAKMIPHYSSNPQAVCPRKRWSCSSERDSVACCMGSQNTTLLLFSGHGPGSCRSHERSEVVVSKPASLTFQPTAQKAHEIRG